MCIVVCDREAIVVGAGKDQQIGQRYCDAGGTATIRQHDRGIPNIRCDVVIRQKRFETTQGPSIRIGRDAPP